MKKSKTQKATYYMISFMYYSGKGNTRDRNQIRGCPGHGRGG